jgi:DNA-binding LacI/PurR family transcriptional regulator
MHLIELGHRRIGVIGGPLSTQSSRIRVDGYRDALLTSGIAVDPELITHGDFHVNSGYELGHHLLTLPHPPTAIFAGSDLQAMGVLRAARELNIAVPEQLSVVGYDDLPMAAWLTPALTTVHQPLFEMAETAAHIALQLARGQEPPARRLDLSVGLVIRQSTAPAVS